MHCPPAYFRRQVACPLPCAARHAHLCQSHLRENPRPRLPHFARAQHQRTPPRKVAQLLLQQADRRLAHRRDFLRAHRGVGPHPFPRLQRMSEQTVQLRPRRPFPLRRLPSPLHLPLNLRLAQHRRIQPAHHPEEMRHRIGPEERIKLRRKFPQRRVGELRQELPHILVSPVKSGRKRINLHPIASGNHHSLLHMLQPPQPRQSLLQPHLGHPHPLQQRKRRAAMIKTNNKSRHKRQTNSSRSPLLIGSRAVYD